MSQYYIADDVVLWNPPNGASRVFLGQVRLFEHELSMASGFGPMESDECRIDSEQFTTFANALVSYSQSTNHQVLQALMDGVVVTVLALAERAGLSVQSPAQSARHDVQVSREAPAPEAVPRARTAPQGTGHVGLDAALAGPPDHAAVRRQPDHGTPLCQPQSFRRALGAPS